MFTHLHVHSHYSILTGLGSPRRFIERAKSLGMNALALTDFNAVYGLIEFYKEAKKAEIKAILGIDMNVAVKTIQDKQGREDAKNHQLVLLAENLEGYYNLLKLSTQAHLEGFYYKPRVDTEMLLKYGSGIIALTGGFRGAIPEALREGDEPKAEEYLKMYQKAFGENSVFLEVQHHPENPEQEKLNELLFAFGKKCNVPVVAAQSSYYLSSAEKEPHEVLMCIRDGKTMSDEDRMTMKGDFSLCEAGVMEEAFKDHPEAISNTQVIADRCDVKIPLGHILIPKYPVPKGENEQEYLRKLCDDGLKKRYGNITKELNERLEYELGIIHTMGYDAYFLIVWDFIHYAKTHDIMVGPGRGSAAGSIVAYVLEITDIDPLRYDLIFERFLNPARVSMPDIDIDFIDTKRDLMIQYVQEKYGRDKVAQIVTFGTMAARAAVRDATRALGYSYGVGDRIAKAIPGAPGTKLHDVIQSEVTLREMYKEPESKHVIDTALRLEGAVRNISVHAAAVVISDRPLVEITALQEAVKGEGVITTQYSMYPIEELGLLKMDFLGLRNLGIIEQALDILQKTRGISLDLLALPLDDAKTYEMLSQGETTGVFQFESSGMRHYLKDLQPTNIEDLIAMVSLYRPGPMEYIPDFIANKHGKKQVTYLDPCLEPILKSTYGVAVYQEQLQKIAQVFAGYTLAEADLLRRAIGKKIKAEVDRQKDIFVEKSVSNGKTKELAEKLFSFIEPFARYGFNKAHAAAYATISYQTAYLKANYPVEYMTAILTCDSNDMDKIISEVADCVRMKIQVLQPSVNDSDVGFSAHDGKSIRFGLQAIKNIGEGPANAIMEARTEGRFTSLGDFVIRVDSKFVNKKVLEALAKVGALDEFAERNQVLENVDILIDYAKKSKKAQDHAQVDLFAEFSGAEIMSDLQLPEMVPATLDERMLWEKELIGVYLSSHPLHGLQEYFQRYTTPMASLAGLPEESKVRIGGIIQTSRLISTKNGENMMFLTLEDLTGTAEAVVFPRTYQSYKECLDNGMIIVAEAKITSRERDGETQRSLIIEKARVVDAERARKLKDSDVFDWTKDQGSKEVNEKGVVSLGDEKETKKVVKVKHFVITIPSYSDEQTLEQVKELLKKYPGDDLGILHIPVENNQIHEIHIPFGVEWSAELEREVGVFLKEE